MKRIDFKMNCAEHEYMNKRPPPPPIISCYATFSPSLKSTYPGNTGPQNLASAVVVTMLLWLTVIIIVKKKCSSYTIYCKNLKCRTIRDFQRPLERYH